MSVSINQAIHAGPTLNFKLSSLLHLRFGSKILVFDLKRAFNQISLSSDDQSKLLFLWYRNVEKEDYSVVAYKNMRLPFGLRCSPCMLMLALYYILVINVVSDSEELKEFKKLMYQLFYMDNGGVAFDTSDKLQWAFNPL